MMSTLCLIGAILYTYVNPPHKFNFDYNWDDGTNTFKEYDPTNEDKKVKFTKVIQGFLKNYFNICFSKNMLMMVPQMLWSGMSLIIYTTFLLPYLA